MARTEARPGHRLARNAGLNLAGLGVPMAAMLWATPGLLHGLGPERFGALSLAWVLLGLVLVFDLGLGRAVTKFVAEADAAGEAAGVPALVWTALWLLAGAGLLVALAGLAGAPALAGRVLGLPPGLQGEVGRAFALLALGAPALLAGVGWRGVLEARQAFGLVNAVKLPATSWLFLGPLAALPLSPRLDFLAGVLLIGPLGATAAYAAACALSDPALRRARLPERAAAGRLLGFGGWLVVEAALSPLMTFLDRFWIGALVGVGAAGAYAVGAELTTKLLAVTGGLMAVLFPAMSARAGRAGAFGALCTRAYKGVALLVAPAALCLIVGADPLLALWLGPAAPAESGLVLRLLALGALVNSLGYVPFNALLALGRPDVPARLHLVELPCYLALLGLLVAWLGLPGAALAGALRAGADAFLLARLAGRIAPGGAGALRPGALGLGALGLAAAFAASWLPGGPGGRAIAAASLLALGALAFGRLGLDPAERAWLAARLGRLGGGAARRRAAQEPPAPLRP